MADEDRSFALVLACFVLSGFAALLYQTAWTREFAFVFGTSELAVATVLAAYMGGLSAGSAVAGRIAPRIRRPVLAYGLLELGIALAALAVPLAIGAATRLAVALFGGAPEPPEAAGLALPAFYLAASFAILLVPTGLMGATLPLLARYAVRRQEELGPRIAILYASNTGGAVLGTLGAAFLLLPALGLRRTVGVGVAANALVFGLAAWLARRSPPLAPAPAASLRLDPGQGRRAWILPAMLASGAVSFAYEVLWTRLLGHVLGGSVYAFATMLASFLVGIAAGSALAGWRARSAAQAAGAFARAQIGIALGSLAAFLALNALPELARSLGAGPAGAPGMNALLAGMVLLPSTLFIGATFPLAVRVLAREAGDAGPASARVYAWNTVGAIAGAVGGGFFVVPALGYQGSVALCAAIGLGLALGSALLFRPRAPRVAAVAGILLAVLLVVRPAPPELLLRTSPISPGPLAGELTYFAVGRSATVLLVDGGDGWLLRTNGLPESQIMPPGYWSADSVNRWLAALPTLARPDTRSLLVIGLGGGRVVEDVPESVASVDVIELEPEVLEANRRVGALRARDPLADPRVRVHLNDARGALVLTERRWDAIVSQPSHPWTSGAAHLYTSDFFSLVRTRLEPGGVFVQWIGLAFVDDPLVRSLVATLRSVFAHVRVYRPGNQAALLFVASDAPLDLEARVAEARRAAPEALAALGVYAPEDLGVHLQLDDAGARRFSADGVLSRDDRNVLEMRSPRTLGALLAPGAAEAMLAPFDPLVPPRGLDPVLVVRRLLALDQGPRAVRVARALEAPAGRRLALALVARPDERADALRSALERDPTSDEARCALLLGAREALLAGDPQVLALAAGLSDPAAAVAEGWRMQAQGGAASLRALEPRLAALDPRHPLWDAAQGLRIEWRLASGEPAEAATALALADRLLARTPSPWIRLLRARAAGAAGYPAASLAELEALMRSVRGGALVAALARGVASAVDELPRDPKLNRRRAILKGQLRRRLERAAPRGAQ